MTLIGAPVGDTQSDSSTRSVRRVMWSLLGFVIFFCVLALGHFTWSTLSDSRRQTQDELVAAVTQSVLPLRIMLNDLVSRLDVIALREWEPANFQPGRRHNVFFDRTGMPVGLTVPAAVSEPVTSMARRSSKPVISTPFLRGGEWRAIILEARLSHNGAVRGYVGIEFSVRVVLDWWRDLGAPPGTVLTLRNADRGIWLRYHLGTGAITAGPDLSTGGRIVEAAPTRVIGNDVRGSEPVRFGRSDTKEGVHLIAWRELDILGLAFEATMDARQVFANWRRHHLVSFLISIGLFLFTLGVGAWLTSLVVRETRRREASISQLRVITDNLPVLIAYIDENQRYRFINATGADWCARPAREIIGKTLREVHGTSEYEGIQPHVERVLGGEGRNFETLARYGDATPRDVRVTLVPHIRPDQGVAGFFALAEDLTEQKKAEDRLRHAEKMQAIGQLTGGIAHDFNNLLTVILGNLELLINDIDGSGGDLRRYASSALKATKRGGGLTQRLLAFARKQPLKPVAIDLNRVVGDVEPLLMQALGETVDIVVVEGAEIWPCAADPYQVENMLLNLAINARDAMPDGGTITIETRNVTLTKSHVAGEGDLQAGEYVLLSVTDAGTGISPDVLDNVFDPFFTTKDPGQGTGLGLSMVYGFVRQSGGDVRIESVVDRGTTVRVYLPRAAEETRDTSATVAMRPMVKRARRQATILVVDDDDLVRSTTMRVVSGLGYRTLEAADGPSAIAVLRTNPDVDLLFTDIVMSGGQNGYEVAETARALNPAIRLLFTTGHSETYSVLGDRVFNGGELLAKPYQIRELAEKLRDILRAGDGAADHAIGSGDRAGNVQGFSDPAISTVSDKASGGHPSAPGNADRSR